MAADHVEEVSETHHGEAGHQEQTAAEHGGEVVIVKNTFIDVVSPNDMKKLTQPRFPLLNEVGVWPIGIGRVGREGGGGNHWRH